MILKNNNIIYKLYKGANEINKFDKDNIEAFIRIIDEYVPPTCPVVIQDIQDYQGSDPEVYSLADEKWYERNNLGQYEEYGIYETVNDLSTATYYPGKLVYYNGHQYESQNGQWVDLGEAGTMVTIQSPSYIYTDSSSNAFSIPLNYTGSTDSKFTMQLKHTGGAGMILSQSSQGGSDQNDYRIFCHQNAFYWDCVDGRVYGGSWLNQDASVEFGNYYIKNLTTGTDVATGATNTYQRDATMKLGYNTAHDGGTCDYFQLSALTMYHGDTAARDFIPAIDNGDICLFDKVSGQFFKSDNGKQPLSGGTITKVEVGSVTPIHTYPEKEEIETEVTVDSLDEVECPFDGLVAIVDGTRYVYENGEWVEAPIDWSQEYLTLEALDNNTQFKIHRNNNAVTANYSLDGGQTWNTLADNVYTPAVNAGDRVMFKGNINPIASENYLESGVGNITATGRFNAMGNPNSLISGDSFTAITSYGNKRYALGELFRESTIVSAYNLSLPTQGLTEKCYRAMFYYSTTLVTAPSVLPALTTTTYSYNGMFNGCSSLVNPPEIKATTMGQSCCWSMFRDCTSLETAPELLAANLNSYCYGQMFSGCTSLNYIKMMGSGNYSDNFFMNWVYGVANSGTFVKRSTYNLSTGVSGIPSGWTVINE